LPTGVASIKMVPVRRKLAVVALALAMLAGTAAIALGAPPVKGAKYTGTLTANSSVTISFKVSKNGKMVTKFVPSPGFPNACGSGGPPPKYVSTPAKIKQGKFKTKVYLVTTTGTKVLAGTATGSFGKHRTAKGALRPSSALPPECVKKFRYTANA
jgi:hypothetical protein